MMNYDENVFDNIKNMDEDELFAPIDAMIEQIMPELEKERLLIATEKYRETLYSINEIQRLLGDSGHLIDAKEDQSLFHTESLYSIRTTNPLTIDSPSKLAAAIGFANVVSFAANTDGSIDIGLVYHDTRREIGAPEKRIEYRYAHSQEELELAVQSISVKYCLADLCDTPRQNKRFTMCIMAIAILIALIQREDEIVQFEPYAQINTRFSEEDQTVSLIVESLGLDFRDVPRFVTALNLASSVHMEIFDEDMIRTTFTYKAVTT